MKPLIFISWFFLVQLTSVQSAIAEKRIYLAPDDHTDYMWTADEAEYENAFLTMTDYYLNQIDASENDAVHHQARWNADGSFWMWIYQKNRTPAQFRRLISRIKSGHFSMPLNALVLSNGGTPAEAVLRGMYYPGQIQRAYDVDFPIAIAMENQTLPYGLSSLWAGSGAKYSWKGVCNCATHVPHLSNRDREIYFIGGPDGSRLLMKWYSHQLINDNKDTVIGGYAEGRDSLAAVDFVDNDMMFTSRYPFPVIGIFGKGEDDLLTTDNVFVSTAKAMTNSRRKIFVSNQLDFFKDFETHHSAKLETFAASYGNEWELYSASMSEVSARVKRAIEKLRSADAMATLVSLQDPTFMTSRIESRNKAMLNFGLYYEHNWTADGRVTRSARADWQRKIEGEITSYVDALYDDARNQLGGLIAKKGGNPRFYVFNSLSWERTDYADFPVANKTEVHAVDVSSGKEVPSQYVAMNGTSYLRILAKNIPPVGYKVFEIRNGVGTIFTHAATVNGNVMENDFYRITVSSTGAITNLIDKKRNHREVVRVNHGRTINDLGNQEGILSLEEMGAVSTTLKSVSETPVLRTTYLTLLRDSNRIDIRNTINQNFSDVLSWNFSFNINSPDIWHEEVGAVIRAKLLPNGGHYSPRNARYDWLTINHFADISGGGVGVTLSNADAYYMKLGDSTHTTFDTVTPQLNILAGGQVDGATLGIPNQGGDSWFLQRFALRTHDAFNQTAAMKFSLEHQNPFVTGAVTGIQPVYSDNTYSFLTISDPDVLLWVLKPAEDGIDNGVITRVWNQANAARNYTLSLAPGIASGKKATHIETDIAEANIVNGQLAASLAAHQIQTHRLKTVKLKMNLKVDVQ